MRALRRALNLLKLFSFLPHSGAVTEPGVPRVSVRQVQGPLQDQRRRKSAARALPMGAARALPVGAARALPVGAVLLSLFATEAAAQTLTPDLLRPGRDNFQGQNRPLRRLDDSTARNANTADQNLPQLRRAEPAPSRIGRIPKFDVPAASGASSTGFVSLGR